MTCLRNFEKLKPMAQLKYKSGAATEFISNVDKKIECLSDEKLYTKKKLQLEVYYKGKKNVNISTVLQKDTPTCSS